MTEKYWDIDPELLEQMKGDVWSIENMEAHEAEGRSVNYIGSKREGNIICDYYQDSIGSFWFKNRAILSSGEIVSMERLIFGREIKKIYVRRTKKII